MRSATTIFLTATLALLAPARSGAAAPTGPELVLGMDSVILAGDAVRLRAYCSGAAPSRLRVIVKAPATEVDGIPVAEGVAHLDTLIDLRLLGADRKPAPDGLFRIEFTTGDGVNDLPKTVWVYNALHPQVRLVDSVPGWILDANDTAILFADTGFGLYDRRDRKVVGRAPGPRNGPLRSGFLTPAGAMLKAAGGIAPLFMDWRGVTATNAGAWEEGTVEQGDGIALIGRPTGIFRLDVSSGAETPVPEGDAGRTWGFGADGEILSAFGPDVNRIGRDGKVGLLAHHDGARIFEPMVVGRGAAYAAFRECCPGGVLAHDEDGLETIVATYPGLPSRGFHYLGAGPWLAYRTVSGENIDTLWMRGAGGKSTRILINDSSYGFLGGLWKDGTLLVRDGKVTMIYRPDGSIAAGEMPELEFRMPGTSLLAFSAKYLFRIATTDSANPVRKRAPGAPGKYRFAGRHARTGAWLAGKAGVNAVDASGRFRIPPGSRTQVKVSR